ncbi:hypothetical protein NDA13_001905 [Ustilago tritici]|nr:hypothetical protein NDA13_001905 [Ustilago tritici]
MSTPNTSRGPDNATITQGFAAAGQFEEPDTKAFATVVMGHHFWAARRNTNAGPNCSPTELVPPLVPFEDLPLPRSDRARIAACTIRWQFTGHFNLNREDNVAHSSVTVQVKCYLEFKGFPNPVFTVNFPRGVGHGRFVDICVDPDRMAALSEAPLVFCGSKLQHHLIGPALPHSALVVEVSNFSENEDFLLLARTVALFLLPYAKVHDIFAEMHSTRGDPTLRAANKLVVLAETTSSANGSHNIAKVQAIPGYINIGGQHCELNYLGRLSWCTTCHSNTTQYHTFDNCPRRCCHNCQEVGHSTALCPQEGQTHLHPDAVMAEQQPKHAASGIKDLNYGSA